MALQRPNPQCGGFTRPVLGGPWTLVWPQRPVCLLKALCLVLGGFFGCPRRNMAPSAGFPSFSRYWLNSYLLYRNRYLFYILSSFSNCYCQEGFFTLLYHTRSRTSIFCVSSSGELVAAGTTASHLLLPSSSCSGHSSYSDLYTVS